MTSAIVFIYQQQNVRFLTTYFNAPESIIIKKSGWGNNMYVFVRGKAFIIQSFQN